MASVRKKHGENISLDFYILLKCISKCNFLQTLEFVIELQFEEVFAVDLTNVVDLKKKNDTY